MIDERCDVAVVGGGPAGMTAARALAERGVAVTLVDEHHALGGQYYKRRAAAVLASAGDFRPRGTRLVEAVHEAGVTVRTDTTVWGVDTDPRALLLCHGERTSRLPADAYVVATGAHERSLPFRGWQLPGVVTPGAALHLATIDRVAVGGRVLVGGTGPFLLPVACALLDIGVDVAAVVDANRPYRLSWRGVRAARFPRRLTELAGYLGRLGQARVPLLQGWVVSQASGGDHVERVEIRHRTSAATRELAVDAAAIAYGFRPNHELATLLAVRSRTDPVTHDRTPVHTDDGRTDVAGVYVAGEVGGIAGAVAAELRGALVAAAIIDDLGTDDRRHRQHGVRRWGRDLTTGRRRRRLAGLERFAALAAELFAPPIAEIAAGLDDDVQVCRCEGVTAAAVRQAAGVGWNDAGAAKGASRAGMGMCQGRQCATTVSHLVAAAGGPPSGLSTRMPVKPVRIGNLVDTEDADGGR